MLTFRFSLSGVSVLAFVAGGLLLGGMMETGCASGAPESPGDFVVKPYVQLGSAVPDSHTDVRALLWKMEAPDPTVNLEIRRTSPDSSATNRRNSPETWTAAPVKWKTVRTPPVPPYGLASAEMRGLALNATYEYRVRRGAETLFSSAFSTRRSPGRPATVVFMGDCGAGSKEQKALAVELYRRRPDLVLIPGDVTYDTGREEQYRTNFYPIYNADRPTPGVGAPLLRETLFVTSLGNHDVGGQDFEKTQDGLAWYYNWRQPLNGPDLADDSSQAPQITHGSEEAVRAFRDAAGANYPRMGNFSFEDSDVHYTFLDSNSYTDWRDPVLQRWLRDDLTQTRRRWRIVVFHHPPFDASVTHILDQQMRVLAPLFEETGVNLVVAGHEHNYQRLRPLRFTPERDPATGRMIRDGNAVPGHFRLDTAYDGVTHTRPNAPLYLVSGAGGQSLYKFMLPQLSYYVKDVHDVHTFTLMNVTPNRLTFAQIDAEGRERDRFVMDARAAR